MIGRVQFASAPGHRWDFEPPSCPKRSQPLFVKVIMLTLSIDAANMSSNELSNVFKSFSFGEVDPQSLCTLLRARVDRTIRGRVPFGVPPMPLPSDNRIRWSWSSSSTSINRLDVSTHFLHSPTEECVTRLREGNTQLPVVQLGVISDRVVLEFTSPSKMATLVSKSKSNNQVPSMP